MNSPGENWAFAGGYVAFFGGGSSFFAGQALLGLTLVAVGVPLFLYGSRLSREAQYAERAAREQRESERAQRVLNDDKIAQAEAAKPKWYALQPHLRVNHFAPALGRAELRRFLKDPRNVRIRRELSGEFRMALRTVEFHASRAGETLTPGKMVTRARGLLVRRQLLP